MFGGRRADFQRCRCRDGGVAGRVVVPIISLVKRICFESGDGRVTGTSWTLEEAEALDYSILHLSGTLSNYWGGTVYG